MWVFTKPLSIFWFKKLMRLKLPKNIIKIETICKRKSSLVIKSDWYPRVSKLEDQTKSLIRSYWDHLLPMRLLEIKHIAFISLSMRPFQFLTFVFSKPYNLRFYPTKYNYLKYQLKLMEKKNERLSKYLNQDTDNTKSNMLSFGLSLSLKIIFGNLLLLSLTHLYWNRNSIKRIQKNQVS